MKICAVHLMAWVSLFRLSGEHGENNMFYVLFCVPELLEVDVGIVGL